MQSPAANGGALEVRVSNTAQNAVGKWTSSDYIMIAGPTASGKSQLAADLARELDGEVINADSMQLYSDLSILTARPSVRDMRDIAHHLYGVLDGAQRASVAVWLSLAAESMAAIRARGRMPIVVGGTGMYLNAAQSGIAPMPEVPPALHHQCQRELEEGGGAAFRKELRRLDPTTADRLHDGDSQRLLRAMGIVRATGRPISEWQQDPHVGMLSGRAITIAVLPPREHLYERINARFDVMLDNGALDEVVKLGARNLDPGLPVMKALGVRELLAVDSGVLSHDAAIERVKRDSRHYAKRQLTWLRNNFNARFVLNKKYSETFLKKIFANLIKIG